MRAIGLTLLGLGAAAVLLGACDDGSSTAGLELDAGALPDFEAGAPPTTDHDAGAPPGDGGTIMTEDTTPPDTSIASAPPAFSNQATATFTFTANEPSTFECSVDGAPPQACTSPHQVTVADGAHTFAVSAIDAAGNRDLTPAEHLWNVDTVAPDTSLVSAPPAVDNSVTVTFELASDDPTATFACSLDGAAFAACVSPVSFANLAEGAHTFAARAGDAAGNVDATPATHAWQIDTSTPDTQITAGPTGAVANTTASFSFSSPNAGAGATFACSLDGATFAPCTSPVSYTALSEAAHTFRVRVTNLAGTVDPTPAQRTWTVDVTAPNTTIDAGPTGTVASTGATFKFSSNEAGATFECSLDSAVFAGCLADYALVGLTQGAHELRVRAVDAAGNRDASPASRSWTVDTLPPTISLTGPVNNSTVGPYVVFTFAASEGQPECSVDKGAFSACKSPVGMNLPAGPHSFEVRAADAIGNVGAAGRSFTVECKGQTDGPKGTMLLPLDEADGQYLDNLLSTTNGVLGTSDKPEATEPTRIAGRFGRALRFASGNRHTARWPFPNGTSISGHDHTIEAWIRPTSTTAKQVAVRVDGIDLGYASTPSGAQFFYSVPSDTGLPMTLTSSGSTVGVWHHVVATYAGTTTRLYVDGQQVATGTVTFGKVWNFGMVELSPFAALLEGDLDEVYVGVDTMPIETVRSRYCPL